MVATRYLCRARPARSICLWTLATFVLVQIGLNAWLDFRRYDLRSSHIARSSTGSRSFRTTVRSAAGKLAVRPRVSGRRTRTPIAERSGDIPRTAFAPASRWRIARPWTISCAELIPQGFTPRDRGARSQSGLAQPKRLRPRRACLAAAARRRGDAENPTALCNSGPQFRELVSKRIVPIHSCRRALLNELLQGIDGSLKQALLPAEDSSSSDSEDSAEKAKESKRYGRALFIIGDGGQALVGAARPEPPSNRTTRNYRTDGLSRLALKRMLRQCRELDLPVIVVAPPFSGSKRQDERDIEARFRSGLDSLQADGPFRFLDLRDAVPDELLFDSMHVKKGGAEIASQRLAEAIGEMRRQPQGAASESRALLLQPPTAPRTPS